MDAQLVRELLEYDPGTGVFTWRTPTTRSVKEGDRAGSLSPRDGYLRIRINRVRYMAHRLAWLYVHGQWPESLIDHRNRVRDDNRLTNLREATYAQNKQNQGVYGNNTSGYPGVSRYLNGPKWRVSISVNGRRCHLGVYSTEEEAHAVYCEARRNMHPFGPEQE